MDSYVIRIYRRDDKKTENIAGQVEFVEYERTQAFNSADELMNILASSEGDDRMIKREKRTQNIRQKPKKKTEISRALYKICRRRVSSLKCEFPFTVCFLLHYDSRIVETEIIREFLLVFFAED